MNIPGPPYTSVSQEKADIKGGDARPCDPSKEEELDVLEKILSTVTDFGSSKFREEVNEEKDKAESPENFL